MSNYTEKQYITGEMMLYFALIVISIMAGLAGVFIDSLFLIIGIVAIVSLVLILKRPFWGFLVYVAFIYLRPADLFPIIGKVRFQALLLGLLLLISIFQYFIINKKKFEFYRVDLAILFFFVIMALSVPTSIYISESLTNVMAFLTIFLFYLMAIFMLDHLKKVKAFIYTIIGSLVFVCVIQIITYLTIGLTRATGLGGYGIHIGPLHLYSMRPIGELAGNVHGVGAYSAGFLANASELGLAVLMALPFVYYFIDNIKHRMLKYTLISVLLIFLISLVFSGSRGAALGAFVIFALIFKKSQKKLRFVVAMILILPFAGLYLSDSDYIDRIKSTADYETDESANIRLTLWKAGLKMVLDRPVLGVGVGNFNIAYGGSYREAGSADLWWEPHNNFVQVASEMGLLGLLAYIWILYQIYRDNKRNHDYIKQNPHNRLKVYDSLMIATLISLIGLVVAGSFITSTYFPHIFFLALISRTTNKAFEQEVERINSKKNKSE